MKHSDYRASLERDPLYIKGQKALKLKFALGDAILRARLERCWSQAELAKRVGTKQANISRIEAGATNPTLDLIQRVLEVLNLDILFAPVDILPSIAASTKDYFDYERNADKWLQKFYITATARDTNDTEYRIS